MLRIFPFHPLQGGCMNKKMAFTSIILLTFLPVLAQQRTGDIYGKVIGPRGASLSGIKITLSGSFISPVSVSPSKKGNFQFVSLPPACDYGIIVELDGFKKSILKNIQVPVGGHTRVNISLEQGDSSQEVVTLAPTPLTDARRVAVAQTVTRDELQSLPTARDPWVVLQQAPGVMVDRENVGGSESGNQSGFVAKGLLNTSNNIWTLDGMDITDPNAIGASLIFYDFDTFEQIYISTGGNDLSLQTGGVAINLLTGRGSNKHHLSGRFYFTDSTFEAKIKKELFWWDSVIQSGYFPGYYLSEKPVNNIKDYGFNVGGPILKEKLWYWGSAGMQDIKKTTNFELPDNALLTNFNFKLNGQLIANNRFEALLSVSNKEEFGRSSTASNPQGWYERNTHRLGSPVVKIQDEHNFGSSLFVSAKYAFSNVGFGLWPMIDRDLLYMPGWDNGRGQNIDSLDVYLVKRPKNVIGLSANYFNDKFLGLSQEIKMEGEFQQKREEYTGSTKQASYSFNYSSPQFDLNGNNALDWGDITRNAKYFYFHRQYTNAVAVQQYMGYISDTISKGNFTLLLGLRYDRQKPYLKPYTVASVPINDSAWAFGSGSANFKGVDPYIYIALLNIMPAVDIAPSSKPAYQWNTWSPRLGLTYDLGGKGKTIIKLGASMYGDVMGAYWAENFAPINSGGKLNFYWFDQNGDNRVTIDELYWRNHLAQQPYATHLGLYRVFDNLGNFVGATGVADPWSVGFEDGGWEGFDPYHPNNVDYAHPFNYFANKAQSSRTSEVIASVEHEYLQGFRRFADRHLSPLRPLQYW